MCQQFPDYIIIDGEKKMLFTNPLDDFWNSANPKPRLTVPSTGELRGYIATWEILSGSLYLIDIKYTASDGRIGLRGIFPDADDKVKAIWYTGKLRIPQGKLLKRIRFGYSSIYESDIILEVQAGKIMNSSVVIPSTEYIANSGITFRDLQNLSQ